MTIMNGRMLFLPSKINKSKKLNIKNIALSLFNVLSFFLSHLRITVIYKSTNNYPMKNDQCITSVSIVVFKAF